jgi:hypothetical protein
MAHEALIRHWPRLRGYFSNFGDNQSQRSRQGNERSNIERVVRGSSSHEGDDSVGLMMRSGR